MARIQPRLGIFVGAGLDLVVMNAGIVIKHSLALARLFSIQRISLISVKPFILVKGQKVGRSMNLKMAQKFFCCVWPPPRNERKKTWKFWFQI